MHEHRFVNRTRRRLLAGLGALPVVLGGRLASAQSSGPRALDFLHTHTGEKLSVTYFDNGAYLADELSAIDDLLRDFRSGERHPIDTALLDILHELGSAHGGGTFEIISAYRSPTTNAALAEKSGGGVARNSLHMHGMAIDVRLSGHDTTALRDAAIMLSRGGVGYYPESDFVHLDTGRVRRWGPQKI